MKIFRNALEAGRFAPDSAVAIGKFDGLHLGHRRLVMEAVESARARGGRCMVVTFDPSPEKLLGLPVQPILNVAERLDILRSWGVDAVVLLPFDGSLAC